jgi:hypothetical protein
MCIIRVAVDTLYMYFITEGSAFTLGSTFFFTLFFIQIWIQHKKFQSAHVPPTAHCTTAQRKQHIHQAESTKLMHYGSTACKR